MNTKTRMLIVRVSVPEYKLVRKFAELNKMNVSEAVRSMLKDAFYYMKRGEMGGNTGLEKETPNTTT